VKKEAHDPAWDEEASEAIGDRWSHEPGDSLVSDLGEADRCGKHESADPLRLGDRKTKRDSSAHRVSDDVRSFEPKGVQARTQVVEQAHRAVATRSNWLLGEAVAAKVDRGNAPTGASERADEESKRIDARSPPVEEKYGAAIRGTALDDADPEAGRQQKLAGRDSWNARGIDRRGRDTNLHRRA
jgi:hypothetical protein